METFGRHCGPVGRPVHNSTKHFEDPAVQVRVKLMGLLKTKTPPDGKLDVPDGATIEGVLSALDIPATHVQTVFVNGQLEPDRTRPLPPDAELTALAPVGGG